MTLAGAERIFDLMYEVSEEDKGNVHLVNVEKINNPLVETSTYMLNQDKR